MAKSFPYSGFGFQDAFRAGLLAFALLGPANAQDPPVELFQENKPGIDLQDAEEIQLLDFELNQLDLGVPLLNQGFGGGMLGVGGRGFAGFRGAVAMLERATLKTDSDSQVLLESAGQLAAQGRFDLSSELWQKVIDQSHDLLFTKEDWIDKTLTNEYQTYLSVVADMEGTLSKLPKEGLTTYRLKADGQANALLRRAKTDEERETALGEIVRRYFLSSVGDEAAFELGCLKFERHEFFPASRLFTKMLKEYPDLTVPRESVELRLAGALARIGGVSQARQLLAAIKNRPDSIIPNSVLELVTADVERAAGLNMAEALDVAKSAVIAPNPTTRAPGGLAWPTGWKEDWTQLFALKLPEDWPTLPQSPKSALPVPEGRNGIVFRQGDSTREPKQKPDPVRLWKAGWSPVGQMLLANGLAYFKVEDRLVCAHADTGRVEWLGYRNAYPLDASSARGLQYFNNSSAELPMPQSPEDYLLQVDFVHQSLALVGETIYCLQGEPLDFMEATAEPVAPRARQNFQVFNQEPNRTRANRLVAYHARSGKLLWHLQAKDLGAAGEIDTACFAGAPVPYGSTLVVPVHEDRSLYLYGLARETGKLIWRTFLCEEPSNKCQGTSPVSLSLDGGDAYVASGAGIVFSVDAISGTVNWATTYPRPLRRDARNNVTFQGAYYGNPAQLLDGWRFDQITAAEDVVIIAPSDFNQLFALDRRTGRLAWESAKMPAVGEAPASYLLGARGDLVYVAGKNIVRAYRARGGKIVWDARLEDSFGRGVLADDALYLPLANAIAKLDLASGKVLDTKLVSGTPEEPLGNLFTDGRRLYVFGLRKVIALTAQASQPLPQP